MPISPVILIERENHIGAGPYQRGGERNGHANGFKPRTFKTTVGSLQLAVPQVRDSDTPFHTSLLEKGSRSDRALKSAIATLYFQGVREEGCAITEAFHRRTDLSEKGPCPQRLKAAISEERSAGAALSAVRIAAFCSDTISSTPLRQRSSIALI